MKFFNRSSTPITDEADRQAVIRQMCANADTEVSTLQTEHQQLQERLAAIDGETARLAGAIQQRHGHVAELLRLRDEASSTHTSAEEWVKVAADTPAWKSAITEFKEAETNLHQAEQQLATEEMQAQAANESDQAGIEALRVEREQVQARYNTIPGKITALRQHKHNLEAELGIILRDEAKARVAEVAVKVDEQAQVLQDLRRQLQQVVGREAEGLQEWPEHRREIMQQLVVDDTISRVLEAEIVLHTSLLDDGTSLNIPAALLRQADPSLASLGELLLLPDREVWAAMAGRAGEALTIRERKTQLETLLTAYRQHKRDAK